MVESQSLRYMTGHEPYFQPTSFKLRCYSSTDVENISVVEVKQSKTFDDIGHSLREGLHDPRFGPIEYYDHCETCNQQGMYCPGHFGNIKLDVPVFNPLFFNFTFLLTKGTCIQCHRLTCNSNGLPAKLLIAQLNAIDQGFYFLAQKVEQKLVSLLKEKSESLLKGNIEESERLENDDEDFKNILSLVENEENTQRHYKVFLTKNETELKNSLLRNFFREHLFKHYVRCKLCKQTNGTMRNDGSRCILIDFTQAYFKKLRMLNNKITMRKKLDDYEKEEDVDEEKKGDETLKERDMEIEGFTSDTLNDTTEKVLLKQLQSVKNGTCDKLAWRAAEVREHLRMVWKNDGKFLEKIFPLFISSESTENPVDLLFCDTILVPPTKFRPIRLFKGSNFESPQTTSLRRVLEANEMLRAIRLLIVTKKNSPILENLANRVVGKTVQAKLHNAYLSLQLRVNAIFDEDLAKTLDKKVSLPGIKQLFEKKEGIFRMNMMGKRVNFACRSVITPDPYLDVDEIGIPELFAKRLTFTEFAGMINLTKLRKRIRNGPDIHPGANFFQKPGSHKKILSAEKKDERYAIASRLQPACSSRFSYPVQVLRHLEKGDYMLMNRQPSLHKPSIMGHRVRILKNQKALRMNYAPCKSYNADFDGDEMNGHFVQDRISQAEVGEIANVGSNFLVPKDGTPLLGLIQDHVISGVLLTLRGRFFNKEDFTYLLLSAFAEVVERIILPQPAMLKPKVLWTGKQIITGVLINCIPKDQLLINLTSRAKVPLSCWKTAAGITPKFEMSESEVIFRQAELLVGVLDKQHYGSTEHGLIHCCWELYGQRIAMKILSCFSRLFTTYLQLHGFSLGVADILVNKNADKERKKVIKELKKCGDEVVKDCFNLDENSSQEDIKYAMACAYCNPRSENLDVQLLDFKMKEKLNKFTEKINSSCVPNGLIRTFPQNSLQLMILSGAKGTMINSMQISCALGQIELEGHRPPMTITGRTLPSFQAFDTSPRAGGFVDQRFLTGINPQELFFHTMAGREGLIDTAVKTSRSGYLQRCIVKHLEGLVVGYDSTVREHDGSVVQFYYGEDGMDITKFSFMNPKGYNFLYDNMNAVRSKVVPLNVNIDDWNFKKVEKAKKKIKKWRKRYGSSGKIYASGFLLFSGTHRGMAKKTVVEKWYCLTAEERSEYEKLSHKKCPRMIEEKVNAVRSLGALPEKMLDDIDEYIKEGTTKNEDLPWEKFRKTLLWKGMRCRVDPGENVGLLAAQSIGEPSTQMTLNTFHFAGRGEMNVTLGIPRLREILMSSSDIKTPSAEVRVKDGVSEDQILAIKKKLDKIFLKQVIKSFIVDEKIHVSQNECLRVYTVTIEVLRSNLRDASVRHISRKKILDGIEKRFIKIISKRLETRISNMDKFKFIIRRKLENKMLKMGNDDQLARKKEDGGEASDDDVENVQKEEPAKDDVSSDDEASGGREADAAESRLNMRHHDDAADYEGEEIEMEDIAAETQLKDELAEFSEDSELEINEEDDEELAMDIKNNIIMDKSASATRIQNVLEHSSLISNYNFDVSQNRWCAVTFKLPLSSKSRFDLMAIIEQELDQFLIHEVTGVEKCIIREGNHNGKACKLFATQGINLSAFLQYHEVFDVNSIYSNDLNTMMRNYGIEACAKSLVKEIVRVFTPYGINVNQRHLTLTADFMTFTGKLLPFSRGTMASSASPLQKMSYETTTTFMRDALIKGELDSLESPSARIIVGKPLKSGTGAFDLLLQNEYILGY